MEKVQQVHKRKEMDNNGPTVIHWSNNEFLLMKTHLVLNRLSKCANVRYRKNQVLL